MYFITFCSVFLRHSIYMYLSSAVLTYMYARTFIRHSALVSGPAAIPNCKVSQSSTHEEALPKVALELGENAK